MKHFIIAISISLISGCSLFNSSGPVAEDRISPLNQTACIDTYNDVNDACANSIEPQTY